MEEEWMWLTDLDQIRLRGVVRSMCFQIRGDTDSLDADLQQLLDIKEILRSPLEVTYCISDDRRVVLEICAQNKMARALAGPVFLDKLKQFESERVADTAKCEALFAKYDDDHSGTLDRAEVALLAGEMGLETQVQDPAFLTKLIEDIEGARRKQALEQQDEEDEGAAQLAKLPLMSVLVLQVALSFHAD